MVPRDQGVSMREMVSLILGGGKGTRLLPLTQYRSKPAVPLAGKYRLIDVPISNCLNSGVNRIYVLTQFNSVSLHRHIQETYQFDHFSGGFVEILAAQQTNEGTDWYQGTADAVRKQLRYIEHHDVKYVLVLSGDQLYRMDYREILETHRREHADVTIAAVPVTRQAARSFGIMRINETGRVVGFLEKPQVDDEFELIRSDPAWLDAQGINSRGRDCLASMGIYVFDRDTLVELLHKSDYQDFGKEVFPMSIRARHVQVYPFDNYWEDIGTIRSFYEANLALASAAPPFDLASESAPIYTHVRPLPPARIQGADIRESLIADGCVIETGATIEHSVIGLRSRIGRNVTIRHSTLMGADFYRSPEEEAESGFGAGQPPLGVGPDCILTGAIVDKNCRIGRNVRIENGARDLPDADLDNVSIRDGIVVVRKGAVLPDGWNLSERIAAPRERDLAYASVLSAARPADHRR
jgi:glucose-1-phosphate adenylyltransferase